MCEEDTTHPSQDRKSRRSGPPEASAWERDHVRPGGCRGCSITMSQMQRRRQEPEPRGESGGESGGSAPDKCGGGDEYGEHQEVEDERLVF